MMDARGMFPQGWHASEMYRFPDGKHMGSSQYASRTAAGNVRYYFIDFGISTVNQDSTLGIHGQELAPELSATVPYDPYKLDVYILGKAYTNFLLAVGGIRFQHRSILMLVYRGTGALIL